jgi:adenine-specific DNA methylase
LFNEWRKIKKEKMMLEKLRRAEKIQREEKYRLEMADKFGNLMGVLIDPFSIYDDIK